MYLCCHRTVVFIGYAVCTLQSLLCELDLALIWHVCFVVSTLQYLNSEGRFRVFDTAACDILSDCGIDLLCSVLQHHLFAEVTFLGGSWQVVWTCTGRNKTLPLSTSLPVIGEITVVNTASLGGYFYSSEKRARWVEGQIVCKEQSARL